MKNTRIFFLIFLILNLDNSFAQDSSDVYSDTSLTRNKIADNNDSLIFYKDDKDFGYINYLDSLLRKTKNLTVDTFNINASADKLKKQKERNSSQITLGNNFLDAPAIKIILWMLAVFFISFLLYKLFFSDGFFRKNYTAKKALSAQKEDEEVSDASSYNKLIEQAVENKNYRLAVRYLYLQTLKMLAGKGLIELSADKTNYEYVRELANNSYQNEFAAVTLNYEYTWYGKFEIGPDVYDKLLGAFKLFQQKL